MTGGTDWALSAWSAVRVACEQESRRTVVDQSNRTALLNNLISASCYQDCSGNGNCVDGMNYFPLCTLNLIVAEAG